jgi:hypothetical protein
MTIGPWQRFGRNVLFGGGTLTSLLLGWTGTGTLAAQPPLSAHNVSPSAVTPDAAPVQRNYLNKSVISLPIHIDEPSRSQIQEIHLYVKDHASSPWALREKVGPTQKAFTYQVPRDGEYWFTMVTVDKQGRSYPNDLAKEPPGLVVVIDTQPPQIQLTNLGSTPEGQLIQCDVQDLNVDRAKARLSYQGGDRVFRSLEPVQGRPNVYCIPSQAVCTGIVRASAEDLAGNQAQREVHLNQMTTRAVAQPNPLPQSVLTPSPLPVPSWPSIDPPKTLPPSVTGTPEVKPSEIQKPATGPSRPDGSDGPHFLERTVSDSSPIVAPVTNVQQTKHEEPLKRQFVNSRKVFLDYQIENAGQSGVGKVEVWITCDRNKSWQKLSEDTQRKSPVEVQFPGDGLFGVTLVASNGRGVGAAPPAAGDTPDWWIEVDTAKPTAQITKVHSVFENGQSFVHIQWTAQDKNLDDAPVDLFYAATPQGPWLPIAKGLKGEGQHRWAAPREIGAQAHIRLSVRDAAGNTSDVNALEPVSFDDPARPRAVIRGFSTGRPTLTPPSVTPTPGPLLLPSPIQIVQPPPTK